VCAINNLIKAPMNLVILLFLKVNNVIPISEEKVFHSHYTTINVGWTGIVSMCISATTILYGLRWNNKNLSKNKSRAYQCISSLCIYSFSFLSWVALVIAWAEFSIVLLFVSVVISGIAVSAVQPEPIRHNPFWVAQFSVIFPALNLPSTYKVTKQEYSLQESASLLQQQQPKNNDEEKKVSFLKRFFLPNVQETNSLRGNGIQFYHILITSLDA
jgi:hypothetical protein